MEDKIKSLLRTGDFCKVNGKKLSKYGLPKDCLVYVAGTKAVPTSEDLYTQRIYFLVTKLDKDDKIEGDKFKLLDATSLTKLSDEEQERLTEKMSKDFGKEEEEVKEEESDASSD